jgi:hypothetical protein
MYWSSWSPMFEAAANRPSQLSAQIRNKNPNRGPPHNNQCYKTHKYNGLAYRSSLNFGHKAKDLIDGAVLLLSNSECIVECAHNYGMTGAWQRGTCTAASEIVSLTGSYVIAGRGMCSRPSITAGSADSFHSQAL